MYRLDCGLGKLSFVYILTGMVWNSGSEYFEVIVYEFIFRRLEVDVIRGVKLLEMI